MLKRKSIVMTNIATSLILQVVSVLSGFIVPRLILSAFGSDVNGLVASLTQILNFITLVDGGIGGVIISALYRPLHEKDNSKISSIIKTSSKLYRKILYIFLVYTLVVAIIYPIIFQTTFSFYYIFSLAIILSLGLSIQYGFSISIRNLLTADRKNYVVSIVQTIIVLSNIALTFIITKWFPNIHLLKLLTGLLFILQPIVYGIYIKKHYKIDKTAIINKALLKDRWSGLALNIAAFIHNNTDIVLLTFFTDLATVSVYTIYTLVTTGVRNIILAITSSISPSLGHIYVEDDQAKTNHYFNLYEFGVFFCAFLFLSVTYLLITSFVAIYTTNITDANYYQPLFGTLLVIAELFYLLREPHINLAFIAKKFKSMTPHCWIEASINIIISIILVSKFGLNGIMVGTICAVVYRTVYQVYLTKKLLNRSPLIFFKKILGFSIASMIGILLCELIGYPAENTIPNFLLYGFIYFAIMSCTLLILSTIFFRKDAKLFFAHLKNTFYKLIKR